MAIMIRHAVLTRTLVLVVVGSATAKVAGKIGGHSNTKRGKSTSGINKQIIWICISMAIAIAVLIAIALCYILREKWRKAKRSHNDTRRSSRSTPLQTPSQT